MSLAKNERVEIPPHEESMLPLYYRIYPGSIPDKAHLKYMAEDTGLLNTQKVKFVMDRGFYQIKERKEVCKYDIKGTNHRVSTTFFNVLPQHIKVSSDMIIFSPYD